MPFFPKKYRKLSDEQLMRLVQKAHQAAMHEIYQRYRDRLYGFFYKLLGQQQLIAEDFTHDLFEKVFRQAHRFDPERSFRTWLFVMAHNMLKNEYRRRDRQPAIREFPTDIEQVKMEGLIDPLDRPYYQQCLAAAIASLPLAQRSCLVLRFREDMSISEISEVLGCPEGTVKSRLHHALRKLRASKKKIEL